MKKFKYLFAIPLVAALTACSSDEPAPTPDGAEMPFYTTMSITLPSTDTRAIEGEEVGQDVENAVTSVKVILTTRDDESGNYTQLIASKEEQIRDGSTYTVMFDAKELDGKIYEDGVQVYAFVVCNDANAFNEGFDIDKTFTGGAPASFSSTQAALRMTSAPYAATLPSKDVLLQHDTPNNAYNLTASGSIKVERSVARFDFKSNGTGDNANKFEIKDGEVTRGYVQITDMALINENNNVYYFGRTNATGLLGTNPKTYQLVANVTDYVVCPLALDARAFNYPMKEESFDVNTLPFTAISSLTQDDNHEGGWDDGNAEAKKEYKIWRYCNENAIPAEEGAADATVNNNQKNGVTTGIVFRGKILNGNGTDESSKIPGFGAEELYCFQQVMYGDFNALYTAAYATGAAAKPNLRAAFDKTWEENPDGTYVAGEKKFALKPDQTRGGNGFTVYKYTNIGTTEAPEMVYPVYYYYWNRHIDNNQSNKMGPMEFSVVRNNVYKLFINSVNMFGSSGTDDDPDKPDPNDPDETEHMYIKIDVQVMPWTVRYNGFDL